MALSTQALKDQIQRLDILNANLTFRISRLSKVLEVEGAQRIAGSGVNLTGYRMMMVIGIFEEISVSDLSKLTVIDRAQISRAASELIERGLLEARADANSRRKKLLALTAAGQAQLAELKAPFAERQAEIEALLDPADLAGLSNAIEKISAYLDQRLEHSRR